MNFPVPCRNRYFLSPLAGVSDKAYRMLASKFGAGYTYTEMVSAKALYYGDRKTKTYMEVHPEEGPLGIQLFGSEPEIFEVVLREIINPREDFCSVDLNMGCPAPKIVKNGEGSALMKNPKLVAKLVRTMVKTSNKPVSVKFREGFTEDDKNFLEIGKICQEEGAAYVTLHARTRELMYAGHANWESIAKLKDALEIPVVGNGDVFSYADAKRMEEETNCDAIAIGRGAMGNPFLFRQLKNGEDVPPTIDEILDVALYHLKEECKFREERVAVLQMRKHLSWYFKGIPGGAKMRNAIFNANSYAEVAQIIENYRQKQV